MKSLDDLNQVEEHILSAPRNHGEISLLCIRPVEGQREFPTSLEFSTERGAIGDCWEHGTWLTTDDGSPSPKVQT